MNNRREPTTTVGGPFRWTGHCDDCEANIRVDVPTHIVEEIQNIFAADCLNCGASVAMSGEPIFPGDDL